jgi:hypothetical protein
MTITYQLIEIFTGEKLIQRHNEDGTITSIPKDPANSDYQRYLAWLENPEAEQSTPNLPGNADKL